MTSDSKFFFQRTILQGFGLFWNKDIYSQSKKFSKKFVEEIDCLNAPDIRKCIKTKNVDRLLEVQQEILEDNPVAFGPVIPSDFVSLLPTEAKDSFEFQIDFMFGLNSEDDSLFLTTLRNAEEEGKTTEEEEEKETESKDQGSEETEEKEEEEEPVERSTSKPILAVTTASPTTTTEDSTSSSTTTTTESNNKTSEALEREETAETEKEEKEDDSEGEGTEESEGEGEDESTDEEKRRRRRKREVDEHVTKVVCPLIRFADQIVESNRSVYIYQLNEFSSYHDEIVFAMGYPLKFKSLYDYDELQFSKRVMKNWAQFATNG